MSKVGWVFRVEIVSHTTPYTKEIIRELERLFKTSSTLQEWKIDELPGDIALFKIKTVIGEKQ
jgi:hypothetical protein